MTDQDIIKYFTSSNGRVMKSYIDKLDKDNEIIKYLSNRYDDSDSLVESLYRIFNNIEDKGKCPICGKPIKLFSYKYGFLKTCGDPECIKKQKNIDSCFHNPDKQLEIKKIIKEKYGVNNPYQINYIRDKANKILKSENTINKRKETCLKIYGTDNPSKSDFIKNKISGILKNKSDEEKLEIKNKISKTCLEKYGIEWYSKLEDHKEKMSKMMSSEEYILLKKHTNFLRYGIENYNNQELRIDSLRKNHSFNQSKPEEECYILIKEKYPDVIRQYHSKEYPYACDFYIPSIDTYIEYNGSQYHHKHPFDKNNEDDIKELNKLKELEQEKLKTYKHTQYTEIIYTWTDLDIRKRKIAKQNNLNFIEFWSVQELKDWLDKQ